MLNYKILCGLVIFITISVDLVDSKGSKAKPNPVCVSECKRAGINKKKCSSMCKIPKGSQVNVKCLRDCLADLGGSKFKICLKNCTIVSVDCQWKQWSSWDKCTACDKCCQKYCIRTRGKISAQGNGKPCEGSSMETQMVKCSKIECSQPHTKPGTCSAWGDPHYTTFDGLRYDYQGDCKYSLVRALNGAFKIEVKNVRTSPTSAVSVTRYADVYIDNDVIRLGPGTNVKVNNNPGVAFPYNAALYSIDVSGTSIQFNCPVLSLNIVFRYGISVTLGRQWENMVDGLCKNFDNDKPNDCSDASGTDITGKPNKGTLLGDSYQVFDPEEPNCVSSLDDDLPNPCKDDEAEKEARTVCLMVINPSGPFAQCVARMSKDFLENFVEDCIVDHCDNPDNLCDIVSKFAEACKEEGFDIPMWRDEFDCQIECGENEVYLANGPGCERKCFERDQTFCNTPRREGCFCKTGYIRCNGTCIIGKDYCPPLTDPGYKGKPPRKCCMHSTWYEPLGGSSYSSQDIPDGEVDVHKCDDGQVFKVFDHNECGCVDEDKPCVWGPFSTWNIKCPPCPKCGDGVVVTCQRSRSRKGENCDPEFQTEEETFTQDCNIPPCCVWLDWTAWVERCDPCPKCGTGVVRCLRTRTRRGQNCNPNFQTQTETSIKKCSGPPCCVWLDWTAWNERCDPCPKCGTGVVRCLRTRTRRGQNCNPNFQTQTETSIKKCSGPPCCVWSNWSVWTENCPSCPKCGGGTVTCTRTRTRRGRGCTPSVQTESGTFTKTCITPRCCYWGPWRTTCSSCQPNIFIEPQKKRGIERIFPVTFGPIPIDNCYGTRTCRKTRTCVCPEILVPDLRVNLEERIQPVPQKRDVNDDVINGKVKRGLSVDLEPIEKLDLTKVPIFIQGCSGSSTMPPTTERCFISSKFCAIQ